MPVIVAIAIRYIIMAAIQLAIWSLIEKYGLPLLNKGVEEIMIKFGVSEEDAKAIMANKLIVAFEEVGIFAATLKTKLPIKVAEYLGFTTKGWALRKLSTAVEAKVAGTAISATTKAVATTAEVEKIAEVVSKSSGWAIKGVGDLLKYVTLFVGTPVGVFYALAQYIDYGAWQNPYQKTFQGLLSYIGINVSDPLPSAKTISQDNWKRIYNTIEQLKPLGITLPVSNTDVPYSRENLAKAVDEIAANLTKNGTQATYKTVIAILLLQLQFNGVEPKVPTFPAGTSFTAVAPANASGGGSTIQTTKVFTGIVSQGVVSEGLVFTPRPDDLIESVEELRDAAANNLAPFLQALPGKIVYEVKVVSSIITKDGFKQTGTSQKIITGYYSNGVAKYKNVTNKFATLVIYAITDKGSRAKLSTIVLGPTNSAKLTVAQNDLQALQDALPDMVTTTKINEITNIKNTTDKFDTTTGQPNPDYVAPTTTTTPQPAPEGTPAPAPSGVTYIDKEIYDILINMLAENAVGTSSSNGVNIAVRKVGSGLVRMDNAQAVLPKGTPAPVTKPTPVLTGPGPTIVDNALVPGASQQIYATTQTKAGANATTLSAWYTANGMSLPSISVRAQKYQSLGLGQASFYTGTAEQNTKLLNALKAN